MPRTDARMKLIGEDGNASAIMGRATRAMRRAGYGEILINAYRSEAKSGDYDNLLTVTMDWLICDDDNETEE